MTTKNIKIEKEFWGAKKTKLKSEKWIKNEKCHRLDGPAYQAWYENGQKCHEEWCKNGKTHRIGGPARLYWGENGQKWIEGWYKDGMLHRLDGPALQIWYEDGRLIEKQYFIDGKQYTEEEFNIMIKHRDSIKDKLGIDDNQLDDILIDLN